MKKQLLSVILVLCLCLSSFPMGGWAASKDDTGLCPHHTEHTEACGYGDPCTFVCDACAKEAEEANATPEPEPTNAPVATEAPVIPEEPAIPEQPVVSDDPVVTEEPTIPEQPVVSDEPVISDDPVVTEEPTIVEDPVVTEEAVVEEEPETTEEPEIIVEPEATAEPSLEDVLRLMEENYRKGILPPAFIDMNNYLSGIAPAAFLEQGKIDKANFSYMGLAESIDKSPWDNWGGYDISGGFNLNKFPNFVDQGYRTASVTVDDAELVALGIIRRTSGSAEEKTDYIYYMTTDQNESEISAMIIKTEDENKGEIHVNYAFNDYNLTYDVQMADGTNPPTGVTVESVFGGTNPATTTNGAVSFDVTIPYGYTAKVWREYLDGTNRVELTGNRPAPDTDKTVNEGYDLGAEPVYKKEGNDVVLDSNNPSPSSYRISATFHDDHVTEDRHIVVELTKRPAPKFITQHWTGTIYADGRGGTGTDAGWNGNSTHKSGNIQPDDNYGWKKDDIIMDEIDSDTYTYSTTWTFQTSTGTGHPFLLDSLEFNGVALNIPYVPTSSYGRDIETGQGYRHVEDATSTTPTAEDDLAQVRAITEDQKITAGSLRKTTLPDGTVVAIELVRYWGKQRVYTVTITGAHSNITITGGNLMQYGSGAEEFIPSASVGIDANNIESYYNGDWVTRPAAEAVVSQGPDDDSSFHNFNIRFKLEIGYEMPFYTWINASTNETVEKGETVPLDTLTVDQSADSKKVYGPDDDGWYYIHLNEKPENKTGKKVYTLNLSATAAKYIVRYMVGSQDVDGDELTNPPLDENVRNMPVFNTNDSDWDDELDNPSWNGKGEHIERYDDNGGNFYDLGEFHTIAISDNEPIDISSPKKYFQYWVVVDENEKICTKMDDGKLVPVIIRPNAAVELKDLDVYGLPLRKDIGGDDKNYYVIRLKAVWASTTSEFSYEVHLRWVDKDGNVHPIEGEDSEYRIIQSAMVDAENIVITLNVDSADILNWLARHPTYSLYHEANKNYEIAPDYNEDPDVDLADPQGNYHFMVTNGGQINVWMKEDRGTLSFKKTVVGDDTCNGTLTFTIKGPADFTGTSYAWPQDVTWAASNSLQIYFENGEATLNVSFKDGVAHLRSEDGKDYDISRGVTLFVPNGDYTITENLPAGSGYTPQVNGVVGENSATVKVIAGDETVHLQEFVNTVKPVDLENAPYVQKTIKGDTPTEAGTFTFELFAAEGANYGDAVELLGDTTVTFTIPAGQTTEKAPFGGIRFNAAGTYRFTVRESNYPAETDTYSYTPEQIAKTWCVTVENVNGNLMVTKTEVETAPDDSNSGGTASIADGTDTVEIINTYLKKDPAFCYESVQVKKALIGRRIQPGGFTFNLKVDPNGKQDGIKLPKTTSSNGSRGDVFFGDIEFSQEGTYTVVITEVNGGRTDVDYDDHELKITYKVIDNGSGKLVLDGDPVYDGDTTFTNTAFVKMPITVAKSFTGKTWEDEAFTATVSITGGDSSKVQISDDGDDNYRDIGTDTKQFTFTKGLQNVLLDFRFMAAGTYIFTIVEDNGWLPGITYDTAEHTIVATVTDALGKLSVDVEIDGEPATLDPVTNGCTFTLENTYSTNVITIPVSAYKHLNGATLVDHQFSFRLDQKEEGTAPEPENGRNRMNEADGDVNWTITFRRVGTYEYTMYELHDSVEDVRYSLEKYTVVVEVTRDSASSPLKAEVKYLDPETNQPIGSTDIDGQIIDVPVFTNWAYADAEFGANKLFAAWDNEAAVQNATFTATVELIQGDKTYVVDPDNDTAVLTWPQTLTFTKGVPYDTLNLRFYQGGDYFFRITENKGNVPGVKYDESEYLVKVSVVDAISRLRATVSYYTKDGEPINGVEFVNDYGIDPAIVPLHAGVELQGGTLQAEQFKFELTAGEYQPAENQARIVPFAAAIDTPPLPDSDTVVKRNDGMGLINFGTVTLDAPGVYTYIVKQVEPDGGWQDDIIYDRDTYTVTVNVTRNDTALQWTYEDATLINRVVQPTAAPTATPTAAPTATPEPTDDAPETGDHRQIGLWAGIMIVSLAGVLAVMLPKKKKKTKRRRTK